MPDIGNLTVLTGQQRSGTTGLRDALNRCATIHAFGEVFHDNKQLYAEGNFWTFVNSTPEIARLYLNPSSQNAEALFQEYMRHLFDHSAKPKLLIDIKFNLWSNLQSNWRYPTDRPWLLSRLIAEGASFILLRRENYFEQYLSSVLADHNGIFHFVSDTAVPDAKVRVDMDEFLIFGGLMDRLYASFDQFFFDSNKVLHLTYETLFDGTYIRAAATEALRVQLGFTEPRLWTELVKSPIESRNAIVNLEEVLTRAAGTPFAAMVHKALHK